MGRYDIATEDKPMLFEGDEQTSNSKKWIAFARVIELVASTANVLHKTHVVEAFVSSAQKAGLKLATLTLPYLAKREQRISEIPDEKNEQAKSYVTILKDGIEQYNASHEHKAYWERSEDFLSVSEYIQLVNAPLTEQQENEFIRQCHVNGLTLEQEQQELDKLKKLQLSQRSVIRSLLTLMYSGRYTTEAETLLAVVLPKNIVNIISKARDTMPDKKIERYESIRSLVEEKYQQVNKQEPFNTSEILEMLLELNDGNIQQALLDLCEFYKYAARNMRDTDEDSPYDEMAVWMQTYIADEYSTHGSYSQMDLQLHHDALLNRVGLPYHFAYSTYLLSLLPSEAVIMLVTGEYLMYFKQHGATKALADMFFLKELDKTEAMLQSYSK